jgi:hypothetical protein
MRSLAFLFLFPLAAFAAPAESPGWRALLHFEGSRSSVEAGSAFFLSPEGRGDPAAELAATQALFARDPEGPCRYPARAIFLGRRPEGKGPLCDRWRKWRESIGAEGIELVFAAAFINSPSSMYGHTLLKFPRAGRPELLDYTLNYGAETGNSAGAAYVWLGLTGGFRGYYATAPFYLKVKEYNFVENRDFWIYPLKVSPAELELLVAHAWELREIGLPYFFLRKNCSYYLLEFLEVARPGSGLTDSFPLWAVPMDTIRRLESKGWLGEPRLRPSRHKVLKARKERLGEGEASLASALTEDPSLAIRPGREAPVLDAAYDLFRYRLESRSLAARKGAAPVEQALLARRAKAGAGDEISFSERPPHEGHRTARIGIAGGKDRRAWFGELAYRGTLHDLLARPLGYEPSSELSMGDLRVRWQGGRIFAERFDLLRLRSLSPAERWFPSRAWSFRVGYARAKEMGGCRDWKCGHALLNGGMGMAAMLGPVHIFGLGEIDFEAGGVFDPDYRLSLGPSLGLFLPLWPGGRFLAEGEARFRLAGERRQKRSLRAGLNQDWGSGEIRAEGAADRGEREALLRWSRYF